MLAEFTLKCTSDNATSRARARGGMRLSCDGALSRRLRRNRSRRLSLFSCIHGETIKEGLVASQNFESLLDAVGLRLGFFDLSLELTNLL